METGLAWVPAVGLCPKQLRQLCRPAGTHHPFPLYLLSLHLPTSLSSASPSPPSSHSRLPLWKYPLGFTASDKLSSPPKGTWLEPSNISCTSAVVVVDRAASDGFFFFFFLFFFPFRVVSTHNTLDLLCLSFHPSTRYTASRLLHQCQAFPIAVLTSTLSSWGPALAVFVSPRNVGFICRHAIVG